MKKFTLLSFILLITLTGLWSRGSSAPLSQAAYDCNTAVGINVGDCNVLINLYNSTNGVNWNQPHDWLTTNVPCDWTGIKCLNTRVTEIDLEARNLTGSLPVSIGNLKTLEKFKARRNQLTGGIPSELLQNMPALEEINLWQNSLSFNLPNPVNLPSIRFIYVDENKLGGAIPSGFGTLTSLEVLDFGVNKLEGAIPDLSALVNLTELKLHDNSLTGPIPNLSGAQQLIELRLQYNALTGSIPSWLGGLPNLRDLVLSFNQFEGSIPPELGSATQLEELNFAFNSLSGSIPASIGNLTKLKRFYIDGNMITGDVPSTLTQLANITVPYMDIGYNMLTASDAGLIAFLEQKDPNWDETQTIPPSPLTANPQADGLLISWQLIPYVDNGGNYEVKCASSVTSVTLVTTDKFTASRVFTGLPAGNYTCSINTYTPPHNQNGNSLISASSSINVSYGGNGSTPPNDRFENPIVLDELGDQNYIYNIANATVDTDPPPPTGLGNCNIASGSPAVHYEVRSSGVGGKVVARVGGPAWYRRETVEQASADTAVAVYELTPGRQLSAPFGCDDDVAPGQTSVSNLEFTVEANKTYRLVVWNEGLAPQGAVVEIARATFDLVSPTNNTDFQSDQFLTSFVWEPIAGGSDSYSFQITRSTLNTATKFYRLGLTAFEDGDELVCDNTSCTLNLAASPSIREFIQLGGLNTSYLWSVYAVKNVEGKTREYDSNQILRFTIGDIDEPDDNLVLNPGFEVDTDGNGQPNGWKVKNSTKDKHKCNKAGKIIAYAGDCTFMFKGGPGENSRLQQTLDLSGNSVGTGEGLVLSMYYSAKAPGSFKVKVTSTDGEVIANVSGTMGENSGYLYLEQPIELLSTNIGKVKIQFNFKSPRGKLYLDEVSLSHNNGVRLLPLPQ